VEQRFLDSPDPTIRRLSAATYAVATGVAVFAWAAWGGLDELRGGRYLRVGWLILESLLVWFVVAGIGLRAVRHRERSEAASIQSAD